MSIWRSFEIIWWYSKKLLKTFYNTLILNYLSPQYHFHSLVSVLHLNNIHCRFLHASVKGLQQHLLVPQSDLHPRPHCMYCHWCGRHLDRILVHLYIIFSYRIAQPQFIASYFISQPIYVCTWWYTRKAW